MLEYFQIYNDTKQQVLFIEVKTKEGDTACGTAFHIGDGLLVTAAHNVASAYTVYTQSHETVDVSELLKLEERDLAILKTNFSPRILLVESGIEGGEAIKRESPKFVKLASYFAPSDLAETLILEDVYLFGFPPIPTAGTENPTLVAVRAQVNAFVKTRQNQDKVLILSSTARGGFSGGPVLNSQKELVGVCIEGLYWGGKPVETGFTAALCVDPLLEVLEQNKLYPAGNDEQVRGWPRRKLFMEQETKRPNVCSDNDFQIN